LAMISDMPEADVIFITDGDCQITDTWLNGFLNDKKKIGFKIYSIQIGYHHTATLERFSDMVFRLMDDGEHVVLGEIFQI